ncbi:hypothetical protein ATER59S_05064 [Aquamicrobium terrae]
MSYGLIDAGQTTDPSHCESPTVNGGVIYQVNGVEQRHGIARLAGAYERPRGRPVRPALGQIEGLPVCTVPGLDADYHSYTSPADAARIIHITSAKTDAGIWSSNQWAPSHS